MQTYFFFNSSQIHIFFLSREKPNVETEVLQIFTYNIEEPPFIRFQIAVLVNDYLKLGGALSDVCVVSEVGRL